MVYCFYSNVMLSSNNGSRCAPDRRLQACSRAFSLVQLVVAVAIIAVLASVGMLAVTRYQTAVNEQKLRSDVATLNNAARAFLANGGNFTGVDSTADAVARLKSVATAAERDEVVGLRGSMIDLRTTPVPLPAAEEAGSRLRARWDPSTQKFELVTSGAGAMEFALRGPAVAPTHQRATSVKFSKEDSWIWDYTDRSGTRPAPPVDSTLISPDLAPPAASAPASAVALNEPSISVSGGTYPLTSFPIEVSIIPDAGNPGDAVEFFSLDGGSTWIVYTDPFVVNPDTVVTAYSATSDPDNFIDSPQVSEEYETEAVQLEFDLLTLKTSYSYPELGGALMPGSPPPPPPAPPARFELVNAGAIPVEYQNSSAFEVRYTYHGSDPLSDPGANIGDPFTNGFPGQDIPVGLSIFGSGTLIPIQAVGKALNTDALQDSDVETVVISADVLPLPAPEVNVNETNGEVSLDLVLGNADVPEGAFIYYSIDGTDPGDDGNGGPVEGQLYTDPFTPEADVQIIARVYAPAAVRQWFAVSDPVLETLVLPKYDVYIGGDFYLDGTSKTYRNVARLAADGLIDPAFNPGNGANAGSIVGVVIRQGGNSVLVGGDFQTMGSTIAPAVVRLDSSGAVDGSFDAGLE